MDEPICTRAEAGALLEDLHRTFNELTESEKIIVGHALWEKRKEV